MKDMDALTAVNEARETLAAFKEHTTMSMLDEHREDSARCCEETARAILGQREAPTLAEFSGIAMGFASEVALAIAVEAMAAGFLLPAETIFDAGAKMLRGGWRRGNRLMVFQPGQNGAAS